jgi:hypothetical protein
MQTHEQPSHSEWSRRRFRRLDRKNTGLLSDAVLTSEEFVKVVKEAIGVPLQSHAVMTAGGLRDWMLRHVQYDANKDSAVTKGGLDCEAFSALTWKLKHLSTHPRLEASFIFAIFDSDGDGKINREEFKQIYQFFTKQTAPAQTILKLWVELDDLKRGFLDKRQYMKWLQRDVRQIEDLGLVTSTSSLWAIPEEPESPDAAAAMNSTTSMFKSKALSSVFEFFKAAKTARSENSSSRSWFPRHHISDNMLNDAIHPYLRDYFSRPRSEWCTPEGRSRLLGQLGKADLAKEAMSSSKAEDMWDTRCWVVESRINEQVNPRRRKYFQ